MLLSITLSTFTDLILNYYLSALNINYNVDDRSLERQYMLNITITTLSFNKLFITQLDNIIYGNIIHCDRICGDRIYGNRIYDGRNAILVVEVYC